MFLTEVPHSQLHSERKKEGEYTAFAEGVFKSHPHMSVSVKQTFLVLCPMHIQQPAQLTTKSFQFKLLGKYLKERLETSNLFSLML